MARFGAKEYNLLSTMRTLSGLICRNHEKLLDAHRIWWATRWRNYESSDIICKGARQDALCFSEAAGKGIDRNWFIWRWILWPLHLLIIFLLIGYGGGQVSDWFFNLEGPVTHRTEMERHSSTLWSTDGMDDLRKNLWTEKLYPKGWLIKFLVVSKTYKAQSKQFANLKIH